jgi:hypothetical protein
MKKILLCLMVISVNSIAQPTLTNSNNPVIGDVFSFYNADTTGVQPGSAGANQIWDFSGLSLGSTLTSLSFVDPSTTPDAASFPTSNIAQKLDASSYQYLRTTSSTFEDLGISSPQVSMSFYDADVVYQYPFTYNTSQVDSFKSDYTLSTLPVTRKAQSNTLGDGYGTLKLPGGIYNNVLRVKFTQAINDDNGFMNTLTNVETYYWFTSGNKQPLLTITISTTNYFGTTVKNKMISVAESSAGTVSVNSIKNGMDLNLYPNPAQNTINIKYFSSGVTNVQIFNTLGVLVKSLKFQDNIGQCQEVINVEDLNKGNYLVKVFNNNSLTIKKILIN